MPSKKPRTITQTAYATKRYLGEILESYEYKPNKTKLDSMKLANRIFQIMIKKAPEVYNRIKHSPTGRRAKEFFKTEGHTEMLEELENNFNKK